MGSFRSVIFESAGCLLLGGIGLLAVNVLSFGLVYWWIEGGGPKIRAAGSVTTWDFLDYIYPAFTNNIVFGRRYRW
jgi:hypothetical protein